MPGPRPRRDIVGYSVDTRVLYRDPFTLAFLHPSSTFQYAISPMSRSFVLLGRVTAFRHQFLSAVLVLASCFDPETPADEASGSTTLATGTSSGDTETTGWLSTGSTDTASTQTSTVTSATSTDGGASTGDGSTDQTTASPTCAGSEACNDGTSGPDETCSSDCNSTGQTASSEGAESNEDSPNTEESGADSTGREGGSSESTGEECVPASEACDGIDSDCDGDEDILEGFPVSGEVNQLSTGSTFDAAAAYSSELGVFAILHTSLESGPPVRRLLTLGDDGSVGESQVTGSTSGEYSALAAGHGGFGHAYLVAGRVMFQRRASDGEAIGTAFEVQISTEEDAEDRVAVVDTPSGWIVAWVEQQDLRARRLDIDGSPATVTTVLVGTADAPFYPGPSVVRYADQVLIGFANESNGVQVRRYTDQLSSVGGAITVAAGGVDPTLAATEAGYGVVFVAENGTASEVHFAMLDHDGTIACPQEPLSAETLNPVYPGNAAISPYSRGFLVTMIDNNVGAGRVSLARVHDCTIQEVRHVLDDESGGVKGDLELYSSASRSVGVWREPSRSRAYVRTFGANLCD